MAWRASAGLWTSCIALHVCSVGHMLCMSPCVSDARDCTCAIGALMRVDEQELDTQSVQRHLVRCLCTATFGSGCARKCDSAARVLDAV